MLLLVAILSQVVPDYFLISLFHLMSGRAFILLRPLGYHIEFYWTVCCSFSSLNVLLIAISRIFLCGDICDPSFLSNPLYTLTIPFRYSQHGLYIPLYATGRFAVILSLVSKFHSCMSGLIKYYFLLVDFGLYLLSYD